MCANAGGYPELPVHQTVSEREIVHAVWCCELRVVSCGGLGRSLAVADERYMKQTLLTLTILMAVGFAACKNDNANTPTSSTTTTVATTTTTSAATTTTSIPAPVQFTLTGLITDATTNRPVPLADIEIIEGANLGRVFRADAAGFYTAPNLNPGTFTMRVRAFGYPSTDVRGITITNANLRVDVQLTPLPVSTTTTTTTIPTLHADFVWTPDPCTISPPAVVDCTVDGTPSTGAITTYAWSYASKTVANNARFMLVLACSDLSGTGTDVTVPVTLTVTDVNGGTDTVKKDVAIKKISGACP
jgi:protocatechuate 3,4-dioxygenase beta subunit